MCVAFRFPTRRSSAPKKSRNSPNRNEPVERSRKRRGGGGGGADPPVAQKSRKVEKRSRVSSNDSEEEEEKEVRLTEADVQILSQRAKNIQENKAMVKILFEF